MPHMCPDALEMGSFGVSGDAYVDLLYAPPGILDVDTPAAKCRERLMVRILLELSARALQRWNSTAERSSASALINDDMAVG